MRLIASLAAAAVFTVFSFGGASAAAVGAPGLTSDYSGIVLVQRDGRGDSDRGRGDGDRGGRGDGARGDGDRGRGDGDRGGRGDRDDDRRGDRDRRGGGRDVIIIDRDRGDRDDRGRRFGGGYRFWGVPGFFSDFRRSCRICARECRFGYCPRECRRVLRRCGY